MKYMFAVTVDTDDENVVVEIIEHVERLVVGMGMERPVVLYSEVDDNFVEGFLEEVE